MPLTDYQYNSLFSTLKVLKETCFDFDYIEEDYFDVRLRYFEGEYTLLWGDSQYDTDHRGLWGYGSVSNDYSLEDLENLLKAMYLEIEDQMYD